MVERRVSNWYCVGEGCDFVLGEVIGSELYVSKEVSGDLIQTRGPNLKLKCPKCGSMKIWYTSDPLVRAVLQFIDSAVTAGAHQMITRVANEIRSLDLEEIIEQNLTKN